MSFDLTFPSKSHPFSFTVPQPSIELAEFCGIMLGDGGISDYQASITLNSDEEKEYGSFVTSLITDLFSVTPGMYRRKESNAFTIFISRIGIVKFLTEVCGLVSGNKVRNSISIPSWILENEEYRTACVRGLIDTDGSVFTHRYVSKGKLYAYKKLSFTSASEPLLNEVLDIFIELGLHARLGSRKDVRVDSKVDVARYFDIFGSHNPKHLKRLGSTVG